MLRRAVVQEWVRSKRSTAEFILSSVEGLRSSRQNSREKSPKFPPPQTRGRKNVRVERLEQIGRLKQLVGRGPLTVPQAYCSIGKSVNKPG
jgi:hypothetical protein